MADDVYTGPKARLSLVGVDGNAFAIMGVVVGAMRRQGIAREVQTEYQRRAMSGDYDNLLRVSLEYTEEPNDGDTQE